MKRLALPLLAVVLVGSGCAHSYVMRLGNGAEIVTSSKPKLKDGVYHFKDAHGQDHVVSQARVIQVEPASMAQQERRAVRSTSTGAPQPKKPRHWYFLWLA